MIDNRFRACLPALLTFLILAAPAGGAPREVELRGTLLCRVEGDARRERAMDGHFLVVEPEGYPQAAEVLEEAGLFRIRVPVRFVDQHVTLRIYRDRDEVHAIRFFLERGRLKRTGDRCLYMLGATTLPGRCEDFVTNASAALGFRDQIRLAGGTGPERKGGVSKPVVGGALGAVLSGLGLLIAPASDQLAADTGLRGMEFRPRLTPADWPTYSQFSSSLNLGRTLTSIRDPGEGAYWNPSSLVHQAGHRLSLGGGEQDQYQASLAFRLPVDPDASPLVPRVLTGGFLGYLSNDSFDSTVDDERVEMEMTNREAMWFVGLGYPLSPDAALPPPHTASAARRRWMKTGGKGPCPVELSEPRGSGEGFWPAPKSESTPGR